MRNDTLFAGLHIHKCAGTTLQIHLEKNLHFRFRHTNPYVNNINGLTCIDELSRSAIDNTVAIWGHLIHETMLYAFTRPTFLFTFVREPVERIISWFAYESRERHIRQSFTTFVEQRKNTMTSMIVNAFPSLAGLPSAPLHQRALRVLEHFSFIGTQESFDNHANHLMRHIDIPILDETRANVSNPEEKFDLEKYRDWIGEINAEDMAFWSQLAPQLEFGPIMRPDQRINFFDPGAQMRFYDQHIQRLRLELQDLDQFGLLTERRRQDYLVLHHRLASLLLQSVDPAERLALTQLFDRVSCLSKLESATTKPIADQRL